MKKFLLTLSLVTFVAMISGIAQEQTPAPAPTPPPPEKKAEQKSGSLFVCEKCSKCSVAAKECCGKAMSEMNIMSVKNGTAACCACTANCGCQPDKEDPTKCGCGTDVKNVSVKGMYVCGDGKCTAVSDKAGNCACGKALVQAK